MLDKDRARTILSLALPIIGGMVSQNILNLVDTAMVGTLGDAALAAVGMGGFLSFMSQALLMGLSVGVQALAARRKGEGADSEMALPLNGGLMVSLLCGAPLTIALWYAAPHFYPWLIDDPGVIAEGLPYYRARMLASSFVAMNFCFRGYFNGVSRSGLYMRTLVIMHICNVAISYCLIFGKLGLPELGTQGAGIGTASATVIGTLTYVILAMKHARHAGFLRARPSAQTLGRLLRLSIPSAIQTLFFASGLTAQFWIIGRVGTAELAAANVLINLMLVLILPGIAMGIAAASLAGQALGRKEPEEAVRWGWDVTKLAAVVLGAVGLPMIAIPRVLLSGFIHDPQTLELAVIPLQLVGAIQIVEALGQILQGALQGVGDTRRVMVVSIVAQWGLYLPAAYVVGPMLGYGLIGIWLCFALYRLLLAASYVKLWAGRKWLGIEI